MFASAQGTAGLHACRRLEAHIRAAPAGSWSPQLTRQAGLCYVHGHVQDGGVLDAVVQALRGRGLGEEEGVLREVRGRSVRGKGWAHRRTRS